MAKRRLVRIVRSSEGAVAIDPSGRANGRGAYVHEDAACWQAALTRDGLARALRVELRPNDRAALLRHADELGEPPAPAERS